MEYTPVITAALSIGGLGAFFGIMLAFADRKLRVPEDPKIDQVTDLLPAVNCGSCGYPGCANFAESLVKGEAELSSCPVCNAAARLKILKVLGGKKPAGKGVRKVAVVMCRASDGGKKKGEYHGVQTCLGASFVSGGERSCNYGCQGYGDCEAVCPFDAIDMVEGLPVINRDKCTACGKCVEGCPRKIIELHPVDRHVFVLCKNKEKGRAAKDSCHNACIGCGLCVRAVGGAGLEILENLAEIDYGEYTKDIKLPTHKCPTKAICIVGHEDEK